MNRRYRTFRAHGHGPVISFIHGVPWWLCIVVGAVGGLFL